MISLLYGGNTTASRNELNILKEAASGKEIICLDGAKINETELVQAIESESLFNNDKVIIIENLYSRKKAPFWKNALLKNSDKNIIIWENRDLPKSFLDLLPRNTKIKFFKLPVVLFKFLESLGKKDPALTFSLLNETLKKEQPELIFYMLTRHIRNLIIAKDENCLKSLGLSPWQLSRLTTSAKYFNMEKLISIYKKLLDVDIKNKSGLSPLDIRKQIEMIIVNYL